ncbi:hypothetical protein WR25_26560 [Diploscapter pachys]|uniref:Abnormal cell migration protein 18-like fibronectin type I domain-containing protein n=1 Tax=Diploscapter pachys TaxID=2018661 RepID=A0A2A2LSD3_9BILA|nr:hypothetical protein WR25_26560 [Diploscapter pachys]
MSLLLSRCHYLWIALLVPVFGCIYKGKNYKDKDTFIDRSTFVIECRMAKDGTSWSTKVIGCRTALGTIIKPGQKVNERNTTYECGRLPNGWLGIKKTYYDSNDKNNDLCNGRKLGETWIENINLRKKCTAKGIVVNNCLTDTGIPINLNQTLTFSSVKYRCIEKNGIVTIQRERVGKQINSDHVKVTKTPHLTELLGANSKRLKEINRFITEQPDTSSKGMQQVVASNIINEVGDGLACEEFGKIYKVNET